MRVPLFLGLWFLLSLAQMGLAQQVSFPQPTGYVVDESRIIDEAARLRMEAWITELKQKTSAEVAVVTVDTTGPLTIEEYALKLFQRFGIGQKGKDNGVLLLVAYKDARVRIEVGYGLEGAVTDAKSSGIINGIIVPEFKQGRFSEGIEKGLGAIVSLIAKEYNIVFTGPPEPIYQTDRWVNGASNFWVLLLIFCILFFQWTSGLGYFGGGYGSGGYSQGGFGGGFGGFGGGGSGGGGASGGW